MKPALLLAGSLGSTPAMWNLHLPAWRERFDVHVFDYPGHGVPMREGGGSADSLVRSLIAFADGRGVGRFTYIGLSLGGMLGLALGRQYPLRVQRMVLANCRFFQTDGTRAFWDGRIRDVANGGIQSITEDTLSRWLGGRTRNQHPERAASVRGMLGAVDPAGYIACATAVRDFDATAWLAGMEVPSLAISGSDDGAAPTDIMKAMAERMPRCSHIDLAACSHLSTLDAPDAFRLAVDSFLTP